MKSINPYLSLTRHLQCRLFEQPMVQVVSAEDGQWLLPELLQTMVKAGGCGAIWKPRHEVNQSLSVSDTASAMQAV